MEHEPKRIEGREGARRQFRYYDLVMAAFVAILLLSNIIGASKPSFITLPSGDTGIKNLTQMQCSAAVATGAIDFTIGHPIAFMPCGIANFVCEKDGLTTSISLERIFDDACLAFLEICKGATTATTYTGTFTTLRG